MLHFFRPGPQARGRIHPPDCCTRSLMCLPLPVLLLFCAHGILPWRSVVSFCILHALFECKTHDEIRAEFLGRVEKVYPPFGGMSADVRLSLLLSDDTPKEIDNILYRFLIQLFASRERGLASGPAGGRP